MAKRSGIQEELAKWRKFLKGVLKRADRPHRLDHEWTRGKYGVAYEPEATGFCTKHRVVDDEGKYLYTINDPFCRICFPESQHQAKRFQVGISKPNVDEPAKRVRE